MCHKISWTFFIFILFQLTKLKELFIFYFIFFQMLLFIVLVLTIIILQDRLNIYAILKFMWFIFNYLSTNIFNAVSIVFTLLYFHLGMHLFNFHFILTCSFCMFARENNFPISMIFFSGFTIITTGVSSLSRPAAQRSIRTVGTLTCIWMNWMLPFQLKSLNTKAGSSTIITGQDLKTTIWSFG